MTFVNRTLGVALAMAIPWLSLPRDGAAQDPCPSASSADAAAGWSAYGESDLATARARFEGALDRCANDGYSRTGLGYVELREGNTERADTLFTAVIATEPDNVDALVGLGLVRWRTADLDAVGALFSRVLELAPDHPTAVEYLTRIEGRVLGDAPERPELVLPDRLVYPARTAGDRFEIRTPDGWRPFWVKGVNLGAALPGRHPSEFPDSATYARWIRGMADMNANTVRVYTVHPPHFYDALLEWNTGHPERALWLIHGVWTELPEGDDFGAADYEGEFFGEMRDVVDVVHGRADIEPRPGRAFGYYTSDVSAWTLAYIIGREWEPFSAMAYDSIRGGAGGFEGTYVTVRGGNAMDAWMGKAVEHIVAYETETYRAQRPVAYTNWPTLDPLDHPTEPTVDEEMAIRRALGETPDVRIREYDNDGIALDASLVSPTERLLAGYFASYHAYPYYPDFMVLDDGYRSSSSSFGPSNYFGYLRDLKRHHPGMPVMISEYGVPASLGTGHLQPQGWHHGGLTEAEMAQINGRLTEELAEAGMAGGVLFAWIDEWFKKNWVTIEFELPSDRNRLWYNRLDAEQHYGMWAMEAEPPLTGATLSERVDAWRERAPLYGTDGLTVRAAHDEAYLWLLVETVGDQSDDSVMVGLDVIHPDRGDFRWPGGAGGAGLDLPVGVEFVLVATADEVRIVADPPSNPFRLEEVGQGGRDLDGVRARIEDPPADLFYARREQRFNLPYYSRANDDGRYDSLRVIVNRRRFTRDSTEYLAIGYDRGVLPPGVAPDGFWERSSDGTILEVRIPWLLINVTDPSSRTVLQGPGEANTRGAERGADGLWSLRPGVTQWPDSIFGPLGTEQIDGIGVVAAVLSGEGSTRSVPLTGDPVVRYRWPKWEEPRFRERARPVYDEMRTVFRRLDPYASAASASEPGGLAAAPAAGVGDEGGVRSPVSDTAEEADAAWRAGDTDRAFRLYEARLRAHPDDGASLHRMALMMAWREEYGRSLDLFARLEAIEPRNLDARVDRARVLAWRGDTDEALSELAEVLDGSPDHPGALEARALFQAWAGRYEESLNSYERLLSISPDNGAARRQQARVLSWAADFDGSREAYEAVLAENPDDVEARLGLAKTLAYADQLEQALGQYDRILERDPENRIALQGKGRTLAWADRLVEGERVLRETVALDEADASSWVVLGQILQWQGRNAAAKEALERAVMVAPTNSDARKQLADVKLTLAPLARPSTTYESDSDGNRMLTTSVSAGWHPRPRFELRLDGYHKDVEQGPLERTVFAGQIGGVFVAAPGWRLSGGVGATRTDAGGDPTYASGRVGVRSPQRGPVSFSFDMSSQVLDETARLADSGVRFTSFGGGVRWKPRAPWRVDGSIGYTFVDGSENNTRLSGSIAASRRVGRYFSLGASLRTFGYDKNLDDGYFDPNFYGIAELPSYWRWSRPSWSLLVEAAPGIQQVMSGGPRTFSLRGSARVGYRITPSRELSLSYGYSSAGLINFSTGSSDYRYSALILALNWTL